MWDTILIGSVPPPMNPKMDASLLPSLRLAGVWLNQSSRPSELKVSDGRDLAGFDPAREALHKWLGLRNTSAADRA
jgi:hypothetical protein